MRTPDEIIAAMNEVCYAANECGYTFGASLYTGERASEIFCGNPLVLIGLNTTMNKSAGEMMKKQKIV